jgi:hypothetical protein
MRLVGFSVIAVAGAASAQQIYSNGPLSTGATLHNGAAAPAWYQWSELQNGNSTLGFNAQRYADNVTLTGTTQLQSIDVFAYVSGAGTTVSPFTSATVQIWQGRPGDAGAAVVFGNTVTNRLASSTAGTIYRALWETPETTRIVWSVRINAATTLGPGTYWIDWSLNTGLAPAVTIAGQMGKSGADARIFQTAVGFWRDADDGSSGVQQDFPFVLNGTGGGGCYGNCDGSTTPPVVNTGDFTCFLQQYSAGVGLAAGQQQTHYANCDGSTVFPQVNTGDFTCFLQKYAAGCT